MLHRASFFTLGQYELENFGVKTEVLLLWFMFL